MHSRLPRRKRRWTACTSELPKQCARFSRLTQSIMDRFVRAFCPETSGHTQLFPWPWSDEFHVGALQGDAGVTTSGYTGARSFCPSSWTPFAVVSVDPLFGSANRLTGVTMAAILCRTLLNLARAGAFHHARPSVHEGGIGRYRYGSQWTFRG